MNMFSRIQKVLIVVVVFATIVVLAIVLGLIWSMPDLPKNVITDEICLPENSGELDCGKTEKKLYQYTKERIDSELKTLNEEYKSYVREVNQQENLIQLKSFIDDTYKDSDRKPAARLVMSEEKRRKRDVNRGTHNLTMTRIQRWESGRDLRDDGGFLRFGMINNDGRIMVPVTGIYAVSSYVDMFLEPGNNGTSLRHAVYKYNLKKSSEVELVSNIKPKQNSEKTSNEQSSFLHTIVKLTSGEEVLVKVSDNADLTEHTQNYLAVYLI